MILNFQHTQTDRLSRLLKQENFTEKEIYQFLERVKMAWTVPPFTPKEVGFFMKYGIRLIDGQFDIIPDEVRYAHSPKETD